MLDDWNERSTTATAAQLARQAAQLTRKAVTSPDPGSPCAITLALTPEVYRVVKTLVGIKGTDTASVAAAIIEEWIQHQKKQELHLRPALVDEADAALETD